MNEITIAFVRKENNIKNYIFLEHMKMVVFFLSTCRSKDAKEIEKLSTSLVVIIKKIYKTKNSIFEYQHVTVLCV